MHDPEESHSPQTALEHAYPALARLRAEGVIGAIGVGSKDTAILARFAAETDIDAVMLAGRYTLLEQPALDDLPPLCERRGISVLNVGVFNSGLLATDRQAGAHRAQRRLVRRHATAANAVAAADRRRAVAGGRPAAGRLDSRQ
jgi:D-threo-aldose 1-dehydrogenase